MSSSAGQAQQDLAATTARIRAHLEHLQGLADAATGAPWEAQGSHVLADFGDERRALAVVLDRDGQRGATNADLIAASRTAVPELAVALLKVLDWLEPAIGVTEPVHEAAYAAEGIDLLGDAIACIPEPADLQHQLIAALRRAGAVARQLPESEREQLFANGMSGWSRAGLEEHIAHARA